MNQFNELNNRFYITNIGTVDFGNKADNIYIRIDHESEFQENDLLLFYNKYSVDAHKINNETLDDFVIISSNKIKVAIGRYIKDSQKVTNKFWGVKLTIVGVKSDNSLFWQQNRYLTFYNYFIAFLLCQYKSAHQSTKLENAENDFQIILNDNIIQGKKHIIIVHHGKFDIEIVRNVSIVDKSDNQFDFLKIDEKPESFFTEKDIKKMMKFDDCNIIYKNVPFIGNYAQVLPFTLSSSNIESVDVFPKEFTTSINKNGTIKDIIIDENSFVSKYKFEISNLSTIKTMTGEYDSRLFSFISNNFYSVVGNITETHLEIDDIDMKFLPKKLRNSSDLRSIQQFIIKQIIRNNSKSISIIMTRYLVFILIDYLKFSKSTLLLALIKRMLI